MSWSYGRRDIKTCRSLNLSVLVLSLFTIVSLWTHQSLASKAYLGMTGFQPPLGVLGHAFVAFEPSMSSLYSGTVITFNVYSHTGEPVTSEDVLLNPERLIFRSNKFSFYDYLSAKNFDENNNLMVVELNLDDNEIERLWQALDLKSGIDLGQTNPYNLFSNNCLTQILETINQIVDPTRQIDVGDLKKSVWSLDNSSLVPLTLVSRIFNPWPFHTFRLLKKGHPLSNGESRLFVGLSTKIRKLTSVVFRKIDEIGATCGLPETSTRLLKLLTTRTLTTGRIHDADAIFDALICVNADADKEDALNLIRYVVYDVASDGNL